LKSVICGEGLAVNVRIPSIKLFKKSIIWGEGYKIAQKTVI